MFLFCYVCLNNNCKVLRIRYKNQQSLTNRSDANFPLPQLHLTYPTCIWHLRWGWGSDHVWVLQRFTASEKWESLDYCVALFMWPYV